MHTLLTPRYDYKNSKVNEKNLFHCLRRYRSDNLAPHQDSVHFAELPGRKRGKPALDYHSYYDFPLQTEACNYLEEAGFWKMALIWWMSFWTVKLERFTVTRTRSRCRFWYQLCALIMNRFSKPSCGSGISIKRMNPEHHSWMQLQGFSGD